MKAYVHKLALIFFYSLVFLACQKRDDSGQNREAKGIILGFSQIGAESAWRTCNTRSVQDAAVSAGIQLLFSNAEQKQENQIKAIRFFIAYQVDRNSTRELFFEKIRALLNAVIEWWDARSKGRYQSVIVKAREYIDEGIPAVESKRAPHNRAKNL